MTQATKIILGIVGATAAGVAVAMIVAPKKTKEVSDKVKSSINDWSCDLKNHIAKTVKGLEKSVSDLSVKNPTV